MHEIHHSAKVLTPPNSWEKLVELRDLLAVYGGETRTKDDQVRYDTYLENTPREKILSGIKDKLHDSETALLKNNYPYSLVLKYLPYVDHYLVWSRKGELDDGEIKGIVDSEFPRNDWFSFVTAPTNKSIPEIWHAHVFINHNINSST